MLEIFTLLGQVAPVLISLFYSDSKKRAEALSRFEGWVEQHKADGNQSATLRASAADQSDDLRTVAQERDKAAQALAEGQAHSTPTPTPQNPAQAPTAPVTAKPTPVVVAKVSK